MLLSVHRSRGWMPRKRSKKTGYSQAARGIVQLTVPKGMRTIASASQRSASRSLKFEHAGMNVPRRDDLVVRYVVVTIVVPPDTIPARWNQRSCLPTRGWTCNRSSQQLLMKETYHSERSVPSQ